MKSTWYLLLILFIGIKNISSVINYENDIDYDLSSENVVLFNLTETSTLNNVPLNLTEQFKFCENIDSNLKRTCNSKESITFFCNPILFNLTSQIKSCNDSNSCIIDILHANDKCATYLSYNKDEDIERDCYSYIFLVEKLNSKLNNVLNSELNLEKKINEVISIYNSSSTSSYGLYMLYTMNNYEFSCKYTGIKMEQVVNNTIQTLNEKNYKFVNNSWVSQPTSTWVETLFSEWIEVYSNETTLNNNTSKTPQIIPLCENQSCWLSKISNNKLLSDIFLPGTTNSMSHGIIFKSFYYDDDAVEKTISYSNQDLTIKEQIMIGVVNFNIQIDNEGITNVYYINEIKNTRTFLSFLTDLIEGIQSNPSQTFIVRINPSNSETDELSLGVLVKMIIHKVCNELNLDPNEIFYYGNTTFNNLTLGNVRSKIVLLLSFDNTFIPYGFKFIDSNVQYYSNELNKFGFVKYQDNDCTNIQTFNYFAALAKKGLNYLNFEKCKTNFNLIDLKRLKYGTIISTPKVTKETIYSIIDLN